MLAHRSGVMGFPLRLLAREIYDRLCEKLGASSVALVTGEERINPSSARYTICTVEAMPEHPDVDFVAVDEIQLCADPERGHHFTQRLMHTRGAHETLFLGSDTIRPLIKRLFPKIEIISRERLSTLRYAGPARLTRLPRRSAIVAFRATDVYRLAEAIRRQKGGAAVILGALSPRTRNAQMDMFLNGDVEYLVATDAIGMGLNLDLDHVAFSELRKFDGRRVRDLTSAELAQIAGRAGRYRRDGTFGTGNELGDLDAKLVEAIETHHFAPLKTLTWREHQLDFSSIKAMLASLDQPPPHPFLTRMRDADDETAFRVLKSSDDIADRLTTRSRLELLWRICQIPNFVKSIGGSHTGLLSRAFLHLSEDGELPTDWVSRQITHLDRVDGDMDAITSRLAHIRIWSFIAHRETWLRNAEEWQERARAVEDRLGDALHERLTQRFVDKRTSALVKSLRETSDLPLSVDPDGFVHVEGHAIGSIAGLSFQPDAHANQASLRVLRLAAKSGLHREIRARARALIEDPSTLDISDDLQLLWKGVEIGILQRGNEILRPAIRLADMPYLSDRDRASLLTFLEEWLRTRIQTHCDPLFALNKADLSSEGRGLSFLLIDHLGSVPVSEVTKLLAGLSANDRKQFNRLGVRFGVHSVFIPGLLREQAMRWRSLLLKLFHHPDMPLLPRARVSFRRQALEAYSDATLYRIGYSACGSMIVRHDILERIAAQLRQLSRAGKAFTISNDLLSLAGCDRAHFRDILAELRYVCQKEETEGDLAIFARSKRKPPSKRRKVTSGANAQRKRQIVNDSPFAVLANLSIAS